MLAAIRRGFLGAFGRLTLLIWAVIVPILSFSGPFGTYEDQTFGLRLLYWGLIVIVSTIMGHVSSALSHHLVPNTQPFRQDVVTCAFMMAGFGPVACVIIAAFEGRADLIEFGIPTVFLSVLAVTVAICLIRRIVPGYEPTTYIDLWPGAVPPRLMQRLPAGETGPIIRLHARDHFVDVISPQGTYSLRMRLGDAIAEMDTVTGYMTHRSHWVAKEAIADVERENGKTFVRLRNGERVPVSRSYRPRLQEAGLL
jgi:hypothetical protein